MEHNTFVQYVWSLHTGNMHHMLLMFMNAQWLVTWCIDPWCRAGAVTVAARELRAPDIVGVYESQREAMETELHVLRSECKALGLALRNAQNAIMAKVRRLLLLKHHHARRKFA